MRHAHALATAIAFFSFAPLAATAQQVTVTLDPSVATAPTTGRLFVIFGRTDAREPRFQAGSYGGSVPFYGMDVDAWKPGAATIVGAKVLGFPFDDIAHMPAGDYYAQAVLNVYTQYHRADGHAVWVHADQWEGQHWATSPGNLVSEVVKVHFDPAAHTAVKLALTKKLPPLEQPADTRWVKHVKMKSELLSKFWGAPVYIGATVLVPKDFDESPNDALSRRLQPRPFRARRAVRLRRSGRAERERPRWRRTRTRRRAERVGPDADERPRERFRVW